MLRPQKSWRATVTLTRSQAAVRRFTTHAMLSRPCARRSLPHGVRKRLISKTYYQETEGPVNPFFLCGSAGQIAEPGVGVGSTVRYATAEEATRTTLLPIFARWQQGGAVGHPYPTAQPARTDRVGGRGTGASSGCGAVPCCGLIEVDTGRRVG
jgi:hypothetical protein